MVLFAIGVAVVAIVIGIVFVVLWTRPDRAVHEPPNDAHAPPPMPPPELMLDAKNPSEQARRRRARLWR
jgi:hypothetical protein